MIPTPNPESPKDPDTKLTTFHYPIDTDGVLQRNQVPILCFEQENVVEEDGFGMKKKKMYCPREPWQNEYIPEVKRMRMDDYEMEKWASMESDVDQNWHYKREFVPTKPAVGKTSEETKKLLDELFLSESESETDSSRSSSSMSSESFCSTSSDVSIRGESPEPSSPLTLVSTKQLTEEEKLEMLSMDLYGATESDSEDRVLESSRLTLNSVADAMKYLSTPIPAEIHMDTKKIAEEIREWFLLRKCSQVFFTSHILNVNPRRLYKLFDLRSLENSKDGRHAYIRMYNWLELTEDERQKILDLCRNKGSTMETSVDTKQIVESMKEWLSLRICTQAFFARHILNVTPNRFYNILFTPRKFNNLRNGKEIFIRMFNWLKLTEEKKMAILDENESSERISESFLSESSYDSSRSSSSMSSEFSESPDSDPPRFYCPTWILNRPIDFIDTKKVATDIKEWLNKSHMAPHWFASKILGRDQKPFEMAINNPKEWKDYGSQGREMFMRMHNWMSSTEEQKLKILIS